MKGPRDRGTKRAREVHKAAGTTVDNVVDKAVEPTW
jgi:hypothetical protein